MRLTQFEIKVIKEVIKARDPDAEILLFGSRTNDALRGGDIDILILSSTLTSEDKLPIRKAIFKHLEEQKIDLVIANNTSEPFVQIAYEKGIRL